MALLQIQLRHRLRDERGLGRTVRDRLNPHGERVGGVVLLRSDLLVLGEGRCLLDRGLLGHRYDRVVLKARDRERIVPEESRSLGSQGLRRLYSRKGLKISPVEDRRCLSRGQINDPAGGPLVSIQTTPPRH